MLLPSIILAWWENPSRTTPATNLHVATNGLGFVRCLQVLDFFVAKFDMYALCWSLESKSRTQDTGCWKTRHDELTEKIVKILEARRTNNRGRDAW